MLAPDAAARYIFPMSVVKSLFGNSRIYPVWKAVGHRPAYWWWLLRGKPVRTPHFVKQCTLLDHRRRFSLGTLVEVGTYYGEMVAVARRNFRQVFSIEIDARLADLSRRRFRCDTNVEILQGDSRVLLPQLLPRLREPALFWLDGGYYAWEDKNVGKRDRLSQELNWILAHPYPHVVLLDDAHGVDGRDGAPTLEQIISALDRDFPGHYFEVENDILCIAPQAP